MPRRIQKTSITTFLSRVSWPTCLAVAATIWMVFHMIARAGADGSVPMPPPGQLGAALVTVLIGSVCKGLQWFGPAIFLFLRIVGWVEATIQRKVGWQGREDRRDGCRSTPPTGHLR